MYYVVKKKVKTQIIELEHINTKQILTDPLTKVFSPMCLDSSRYKFNEASNFELRNHKMQSSLIRIVL